MDKKITSLEDIKNLKAKEGEVIELPGFDENTPFIARVKRPSLMELCRKGTIPNPLLGAAQNVWEGSIDKAQIKEYSEVMLKVVEIALVEPKYSDIKDELTNDQIITIFDYAQKGVVALLPFSNDSRLFKLNEIADQELERKAKYSELENKVLAKAISIGDKKERESGKKSKDSK